MKLSSHHSPHVATALKAGRHEARSCFHNLPLSLSTILLINPNTEIKFSTALDERHLYAAVRYVENNPVRIKVVKKAENYKWSSAKSHVRKTNDPILSNGCYLQHEIKDWAEYLVGIEDKEVIRAVIENTRTGRPSGDEHFIKRIEKAAGRRLVAMPRGRPRKGE
jgi:putative transposase